MSNLAHQDSAPYEVHNNKIVYMTPRPAISHNRAIGNIYRLFSNYLFGKSCEVFADGVDVHLTDTDTFIPDVMIVCDPNIIKPDGIYGAPNLVVEVLSPTTAKRDRGYKKNLYEASGVQEYWIVDTANRLIEVYILKEGHYELNNVYELVQDWFISKMNDAEKKELIYEFKTSLFNDLTINLNDVFYNI